MHASTCGSCEFPIDAADNFCRRCGAAAVSPAVPATRPESAVTVWKPHTSPVVKGAAVMAAGTIGQFLLRRAVGTLIGGGGRKRARTLNVGRRRDDDGLLDEAQIITETVMMRRVRIRRPA